MAKRINKIETEAQLLEVLKSIPYENEAHKKSIVCSLIGHSKIQEACFGYYSCARCGDQLGDSLGSFYPGAETAVIVGHNCDTCKKNYKSCTWKDKIFTPDPF